MRSHVTADHADHGRSGREWKGTILTGRSRRLIRGFDFLVEVFSSCEFTDLTAPTLTVSEEEGLENIDS